jgi:selenocysteine lyase/cysteine desulfurase
MRAGQWQPAARYLDTATYGLPPRVAWEELQTALEQWRGGTGDFRRWQESVDRARFAFAGLVGSPVERVAVGATVSELVGLLAASVPDGAEVLTADGDFTSLSWPWTAHAERGVETRAVPLRALADAVTPRTDVVAVSAVQSATGEIADLELIVSAARAADALVVVDATQACGWLPVGAEGTDALVCAGYKWLLAPRGTAYLVVGERAAARLRPLHAGWFAGEDVHGSYYGLPARLAASARRFDTSPAWFAWIGAAPALELLAELGIDAIHAHDVALANRFRSGLGVPPAGSAIVAAEVAGAEEKLARAGVRASTRGGSLRASFHAYTTEADVDAALDALVG